MGVDYTAYVIAGVEMLEKTKNKQVQKFDPDTGAPVMKTEKYKVWESKENGCELNVSNKGYDKLTDAYRVGDFGIVGTYESGHAMLGFIMAKLSDFGRPGEDIVDRNRDWVTEASTEIAKYGITDTVEIRPYLYCSY